MKAVRVLVVEDNPMVLDLITKGRTDLPISPYRLSRFTAADFDWMKEPIKGAARH